MTATATRTLDNYIGGAWVPAAAGTQTLDVVNPANAQTLKEILGGPTNTNTCAKGVHAANNGC